MRRQVAVGGALGASARYEIGRHVHITTGTFPWSTFWINVSGALALGLVVGFVVHRFPDIRPLLTTGFLGAYTTFSTFAVEADRLLKSGHVAIAGAYTVGSATAGLLAIATVRVVATRRA